MSALGPRRVAVIGAGISGLRCAQVLAQAGVAVTVLDKSRGVGGRMATRRLSGVDAQGKPWQLSIDHGVPGLRGDEVWPAGLAEALHPWPAVQADGRADLRLAVAVPNMPALCQSLAEGLEVQLNTQVSGLHRDERGWTLSSAVRPLHRSFDAVVLAVPPPQAQALLSPHTAAPSPLHLLGERLPMQALWTLIAVIDGPVPAWDLARPADGPLALLLRNDRKPGRRTDDPGSTWVAHASAAWSTTHLEDLPDSVQATLQHEVRQLLGGEPSWRAVCVHRWRYALPAGLSPLSPLSPLQPLPAGREPSAAWDASLRLGACGDALGDAPGGGVAAAWQSGEQLAAAMLVGPR